MAERWSLRDGAGLRALEVVAVNDRSTDAKGDAGDCRLSSDVRLPSRGRETPDGC